MFATYRVGLDLSLANVLMFAFFYALVRLCCRVVRGWRQAPPRSPYIETRQTIDGIFEEARGRMADFAARRRG